MKDLWFAIIPHTSWVNLQLADGADRISALLGQRGVGKGDAVAYLGENSPEFLQVLFGAARLGPLRNEGAQRAKDRGQPLAAMPPAQNRSRQRH